MFKPIIVLPAETSRLDLRSVDIDQPEVWRGMAEKVRAVGVTLRDPQLRLQMLSIAEGYEAMAQRAETMSASDLVSANSNEAA